MTVDETLAKLAVSPSPFFHGATKPYVRWWWLAGPFTQKDILRQLTWVRNMGFGGVELAWIFPSWLDEDPGLRPDWLGPEWSALVAYTKRSADELDLGCDFTFGSCWPFGGSWVALEDAAQTFTGRSDQQLECLWERPEAGGTRVLNHLSAAALERYAKPLLASLRPALNRSLSALFCDSLELQTEALWSQELWEIFEQRFGYSLRPFASELSQNEHVRYDYRKLISETIAREFYEAFTNVCRRNHSYARVQCHGAPTDLLAAYAAVDVPESESLLFPPAFSRIAASAAAWAGKEVVSAEAFTCIYGFPGWDDSAEAYWRQENLADLKLLADSLFAHGVNQIVWHGMPYQPTDEQVEFYASVHVGPDSEWVAELPAFNKYLEDVSALLRIGKTYGGLGVYLPFEDALMQDRLPQGERSPGANYRWEMRHAAPPAETEGFHPLWVSEEFLREARVVEGLICSRELTLLGLYVDCEWMDMNALELILRLAEEGAQVICKRKSKQPGRKKDDTYLVRFDKLLPLTSKTAGEAQVKPLLLGEDLPCYWARCSKDELLLFMAHPHAKQIRYPMQHASGQKAGMEERKVLLNWRGRELNLNLHFDPCTSLLLLVGAQGEVQQIEIGNYRPQHTDS